MTRPEVLPVLIPVDTPVTVVVPTSVPAVPRTIRALMPQRPNAAQHAVIAKTVLLAVRLIQVLMPALPNAEPVIIVTTHAGQDKSLCPALLHIIKSEYLLQNAEILVMNVNITQIVP